jgi:tyrosine-protein kinase Etk/Wzc
MNAPLPDRAIVAEASRDVARPLSLLEMVAVAMESARLLVGLPLAVGLVALALAFAKDPVYTATARILPPQQQGGAAALFAQQLGSLAGLAGMAAGIKNPAEQYVAILRGRTISDRIIDRFGLRERYDTEFIEQTRKALANRTDITAGVKDGLITIDVEDEDPARAAQMANAFVEELGALARSMAIGEAFQRRVFFEQQLESAKERLKGAESRLRVTGVNESVLKAEPRAAVEAVARLAAAVTAAEIRVGVMRGYMAPGNPDLRLAEQEISGLRAQLARIEQSSSAGGDQGDKPDYVSRYRDFKYQEMLFELIAKQYELARIDEARDSAVIQVVDAAVPPERKSGPKRGLIAIAATLATFMLTLLFVFTRDWIRRERADALSAHALARIARATRRSPRE